MPVYEFRCESCEATFDHMTSMSARDRAAPCPHCGSKKTARALSVVAVGGPSPTSGPSSGGHQHAGTCGCGKRPGSCGTGMN